MVVAIRRSVLHKITAHLNGYKQLRVWLFFALANGNVVLMMTNVGNWGAIASLVQNHARTLGNQPFLDGAISARIFKLPTKSSMWNRTLAGGFWPEF